MAELQQPNTQDPFYQTVKIVFDNWTGLQISISNNFAGPNTKEVAEWFLNATYQWIIENPDLEDYELEEFFEDTMNNEFNSIMDDGSPLQLARLLIEYHKLYRYGQLAQLEQDLIMRYPQTNTNALRSVKAKSNDADDESSSEDEDEENLDEPMNEDEANPSSSKNVLTEEETKNFEALDEGWTFVTKSGKHLTK